MLYPRYIHDCPSCKFVGHATYDAQKADAYICPSSRPCAILRFSSEGSDYASTSSEPTSYKSANAWLEDHNRTFKWVFDEARKLGHIQ